jgi:hypothetical protein
MWPLGVSTLDRLLVLRTARGLLEDMEDKAMASVLQAVTKLRPRLKLGQPIVSAQLADHVARRARVSPYLVSCLFEVAGEAIALHLVSGHAVGIGGVGWFRPEIRADGRLRVVFRPEPALAQRLNAPGAYRGAVENAACVGLSRDELVARWNVDHPDDPVPESPGPAA